MPALHPQTRAARRHPSRKAVQRDADCGTGQYLLYQRQVQQVPLWVAQVAPGVAQVRGGASVGGTIGGTAAAQGGAQGAAGAGAGAAGTIQDLSRGAWGEE